VKKPPPIWKNLDELIHPYAWGNEEISVVRFDIPIKFSNDKFTIIKRKNGFFDLILNKKIILTGKVGIYSSSNDNNFSIFVSKLTGL
jgi:hypothetical protein